MISLLINLILFMLLIYVLQVVANLLKIPEEIQRVGLLILAILCLLMVFSGGPYVVIYR